MVVNIFSAIGNDLAANWIEIVGIAAMFGVYWRQKSHKDRMRKEDALREIASLTQLARHDVTESLQLAIRFKKFAPARTDINKIGLLIHRWLPESFEEFGRAMAHFHEFNKVLTTRAINFVANNKLTQAEEARLQKAANNFHGATVKVGLAAIQALDIFPQLKGWSPAQVAAGAGLKLSPDPLEKPPD